MLSHPFLSRFISSVAAIFAIGLSNSAVAGGIGALVTGGGKAEPVYFWDSSQCDPETGDCVKYKETQFNGNFGAGLEFVIGDRDDRITGVFRAYWNLDFPQGDPTNNNIIPPESTLSNVREKSRHVGVGLFGIQVGLVGDPEKTRMIANAAIGAGFITNDQSEFMLVEVGPGVLVRTSPSTQLVADLNYALRVRKQAFHGVAANVGFRYMFD